MNAWLYAAVSSDKQSETLQHQREWAQLVCTQQGWTLTRVTEPDESVGTGKKGARKLIVRLLAELEQMRPESRPEWLMMLRLDRIGRGSIVESQVIIHRLRNMGIRVWTRDQGEIKNDSAMDELMVAIAATVARMENDVKREKSTSAHVRIKRAGLHYGHAPYGTTLIERRPVPYEPEAVIVREIFARRLQGWGVHRLAKWASRVAPDKRRANGEFRKMLWGTGTVEHILRCKNYRNVVVPAETFDAVQAMRTPSRRRETIHPWPLRGAVRCTCGHLLTGTHGGGGRHRRRYYICHNVAQHASYPLHRADVLEEQFAAHLRHLVANPETVDAHRQEPTSAEPLRQRKRTLEAQRAALEKRKAATWDLAEAGDVAPAQLRERLDTLECEIAAMDEQIRGVAYELSSLEQSTIAVAAAREALAEIAEAWADPLTDVEDRQEMAAAVAAIVEGFWIAPERPSRLQIGIGERFIYDPKSTQIRKLLNLRPQV